MTVDWSGGAGGSGAGSWSGGAPQLGSNVAKRSSGFNWNPVHDVTRALSNAYHYVNPIGGVKRAAFGIGKMFVDPIYNTAESLGTGLAGGIEAIQGHGERARADFRDAASFGTAAAQNVTGDVAGLGMMFANLGSTIATPLGLGGQYNDVVHGGMRWVAQTANKDTGLPSAFSPEMAAEMESYRPQTVLAEARHGGLMGAVIDQAMPVAMLGGFVKGAAEGTAATASTAAAAAADAGDAAGAATAEARATRATQVAGVAEHAAHPLRFVGIKTADFIKAVHEQAYPGISPEATGATGAALEATPEQLATARASLAPETAAAEAFAAQAREAGVLPDLKIPERPGNTPSSVDDVTASLHRAAETAREGTRPTYIEDQTGRRLETPAPAWAVRVAQALPDSVNRAFAHFNGPLTGFRIRNVARDMTRYVEIAQNQARSDPAMRLGQDAAAQILKYNPHLKADMVSDMVGGEITAQLNGSQLVQEFVRRTGQVASPEILAAMLKAARGDAKGIPHDVMNALPEDAQTQLKATLQQATKEFQDNASNRFQTLLASRFGAKGLVAALLAPDEAIPMSAELVRMFNRAMSDQRRSAQLRTREPAEIAKNQANLDAAVLGSVKADADVVKLQQEHGITEATVTSLHDGVPPGLRDVQTTVDLIMRTTLGGEGGTFDIAKGVERRVEGISVGIANQFDVPLAEFQSNPQLLIDAITNPKDNVGGNYDAAALWSGPDAHFGTWVHAGPDGTPMVSGEVGIATHANEPLTALQATVLGEAYAQEALWDPNANGGTGGEIFLSNNPNVQAVYSHYASDILDATSPLSKVARDMQQVIDDGGLQITTHEVSDELLNLMHWDLELNRVNPEHKTGDIFKTIAHDLSAESPRSTYLAQWSISGTELAEAADSLTAQYESSGFQETVRVKDEQLAQRLGYEPLAADEIVPLANDIRLLAQALSARWGRAVGDAEAHALMLDRSVDDVRRQDAGRLLAHHDIAQSNINALDGAATIGGRIDVSTFDPLGDYFAEQGSTPKSYTKQLTTWRRDILRGDFDRVRNRLTRFVLRLRRMQEARGYELPAESDDVHTPAREVYQRVGNELRGATMVDPGPDGRYMVKLFQNADLGTLLHEHAHFLRQILPEEKMSEVRRLYPGIEGRFENLAQPELPERLKAPGRRLVPTEPSRGGTLSVQRVTAEERFVTDLTHYIRLKVAGGTVPAGMDALFGRIASLLEESYPDFLKTQAGRALPNDIVDFWDRLYNPEIVAPDVIHDPLSAQYVEPPKGVNVRKFRWESDAAFSQRARQYGEARARSVEVQRDLAQAKARAVKADVFVTKMRDILNGPTKTSALADKLANRASETLARIDTKLDSPTLSQVPPAWRPLWSALNEVAEIAKADTTGATAEMLEEIPTTFSKVMQFAAENGFDPTHVPDMTWKQAQRWVFGHMSLTADLTEAGLRKERTGVLERQGLASRSLEALNAASVQATAELYRGRLVDFIEQHYAQTLPRGEAIPDGWTDWAPQKRAIILGRDAETGGTVATTEIQIVPKEVRRALDGMRKNYQAWPFRMLMKSTNFWKQLILTYSPAWYVKHFIGATSLATLEGVQVADWRTAIKQYKTDTLPDAVKGRSIWGTIDEGGNKARTVIDRSLVDILHTEGVKAARDRINSNLRNIVKTWDGLSRAAVVAMHLREGASPEFAITRAYEALGDFGNLTPFERDAVQAAMPFYAFQKAMFKILLRLPADHPMATGVIMQLGRMAEAQAMRNFGATPTSVIGAGVTPTGHLVANQKLNPLTDSWSLTTPEGIGAALNPFLRMFAQRALDAPVFDARAGMGSYGQTVEHGDLFQQLQDLYTSSPVGTGLPGGGAFNLSRFLGAPKVYTHDQTEALKKRIARTLLAERDVNDNGGFLALDAISSKGGG